MKRLFTSFFILFTASGLWAQESYASGSKSFADASLISIPITITDSGTITDLNIKVTLNHSYTDGLRYTSVQLISPYGTAIILGAGDQVGGGWSSGGQLYSTIFNDEASTSIYSGIPPFAGSFQPSGSLASFDSQSITGKWELLINNSTTSGDGGTAEYTIMVESDSSTPLSPPDYGTSYAKSSTSFAGDDITSIPLTITMI